MLGFLLQTGVNYRFQTAVADDENYSSCQKILILILCSDFLKTCEKKLLTDL